MTITRSTFRLSRYYDIAFSRDVTSEIDFLDSVFRAHAGRSPVSFLDLACGPGYHARAFSRRGVRATGLDMQPEMVLYASEKAAAAGETVEWIAGDMREFTLASAVDLIYCANSSFNYLLTSHDVSRHLRAVASALNPDGLYIFELSHPNESNPLTYGEWHYRGERDGTSVFIDWGSNQPIADPLTQISDVEVSVWVTESGRQTVYRDQSAERHIYPPEIELNCLQSGAMRVVRWFGAFDVNQPLDNSPQSDVMLGVLSKVPT